MKKGTKKNSESDNYKKDVKAKVSSDEKPLAMISSTVHSEVFIRVIGTFIVLLSVFLLFSFVSFFITWVFDYDIIKSSTPLELIKGDKSIQNWGGAIGAFLSYIFIACTFGVASFGYIYLFFIIGLRLFYVNINKFSKHIIATIVIMLWLSSIIGYFVYFLELEQYQEMAGIVGIAVNSWLHGFAGKIGSAIVLLFFTIILPMVLFGAKYSFVGKIFAKREKKQPLEDIPQPKNEDIPSDINAEIKVEDTPKAKNAPILRKDIPIQPLDIIKAPSKNQDGLTDEEQAQLLEFEIKRADVIFNESKPHLESHSVENAFHEVLRQVKEEKVEIKEKEIEFEIDTKHEIIIPPTEEEEEDEFILESEIKRNSIDVPFDPRADLPSYQFPTTDFLINYEERNQEVKQEELVANKNRIVETLKNYNIDISKIVASPGPTVTLYEIVPAPGIRISKIKNLEDDIALSLAALGIRIIAPIPGRGTIGIEVPNQNPQIVSMRSMLNSPEFKNSKFDLPIALGRTISNEPYVADLAKMPHLLMAGATGQGKSVGLNAIISSLVYRKHPSELKFVMVDPKKVELSLYTKIERHFLAKLPDAEDAIITDTRKVVRTLNSLCIEMDQRYDLLKNAQVKNIKEYNPKFISRRLNPENGHRYLPYIVLVIDEFADLIMTAGKEVEMPIARLAQLARAVGIHLIIATQRPSVNIITGTIKANFPARIAFRVTSKIDSRTILDMGGADQLIGRGDMLLSTGNDIIRLQCALIDTEEIEQVAEFIGSQRGYPETFLLPEYIDENSEPSKEFDPKQIDEKFAEAARIIVALQHGSTSIIQRKLSLGYNRAGRIIDQLEAAGIVGPFEGSKAREVKVKTEVELEEILREYLG